MASEAEIMDALSQCFDSIDADRNGNLDSGEVLKVLAAYNNSGSCRCKKTQAQLAEDVKGFVNEVDADKNNKISKAEFLNFFFKLLR